MRIRKFGAIDIGSNAVRLLIANVVEAENETQYKKSSLIRVPVRLGIDAFMNSRISERNAEKLILTMHAFKHLMVANDIVDYMGCATSAMRDSKNGPELVEQIKQETGINISIITGKKEAEIIFNTKLAAQLAEDRNYLYVDVGGGSTEITLFAGNRSHASNSFNIGTLRILQDQVSKKDWKFMKTWLQQITKNYQPITLIGSGGNINKVFKMSGKQPGGELSYKYVKGMNAFISSFSLDDRIRVLGMNPDRADVILPALSIFRRAMKWVNSKKILVPQIGLVDGMVRYVHQTKRKN